MATLVSSNDDVVINCKVFVVENGRSVDEENVFVRSVSVRVETDDVVGAVVFAVAVVGEIFKDIFVEVIGCVVPIVPHPTSPIFGP